MNKKILSLIFFGILILPCIASAQLYNIGSGSISITSLIISATTAAWVIFSGLAVIMFVVAGVLFMSAAGDSEKVKTARLALVWGIVGVIVAIIAYSIVKIVKTALGV